MEIIIVVVKVTVCVFPSPNCLVLSSSPSLSSGSLTCGKIKEKKRGTWRRGLFKLETKKGKADDGFPEINPTTAYLPIPFSLSHAGRETSFFGKSNSLPPVSLTFPAAKR